MTQLTFRAGRAYMVTSPEREAALNELRDFLSQGGVDVDLEITHYERHWLHPVAPVSGAPVLSAR